MAMIKEVRLPQEFTYEHFVENRYKISEAKSYEALCNNGFVKLYAPNGRVYWHVQNQFGHQTPDWKFHISVKHEQLPQAWNLIAGLFMSMKCRSGLKTYYLKECIEPQNGREITVYIMKYQEEYKKSCFANDFQLSRAEEHSEEFWYEFAQNVESLLENHNIEPNGLAPGDLKVGKYVSLRNEAFVKGKTGEHIYPPNEYGWNAAEHQLPFNLQKLAEHIMKNEENTLVFPKTKKNLISIVIPIALATILYYSVKTK